MGSTYPVWFVYEMQGDCGTGALGGAGTLITIGPVDQGGGTGSVGCERLAGATKGCGSHGGPGKTTGGTFIGGETNTGGTGAAKAGGKVVPTTVGGMFIGGKEGAVGVLSC